MIRPVVLLMALVVLSAGCSGDEVGGSDPDGSAGPASTTVPADDVTVVSSTAEADPADLAELVAISPLVVTGRVVSVDRGDVVPGEDGADATSEIESALVTVEVDRVLTGADPGATVVVEEEGWLDGARISVDGAPPSEEGDEGIWFLVHTGAPEAGPWITVGRVGRWVVRDGVLVGPRLDIGLAIDLQDRPLDEVVADVEGLIDP